MPIRSGRLRTALVIRHPSSHSATLHPRSFFRAFAGGVQPDRQEKARSGLAVAPHRVLTVSNRARSDERASDDAGRRCRSCHTRQPTTERPVRAIRLDSQREPSRSPIGRADRLANAGALPRSDRLLGNARGRLQTRRDPTRSKRVPWQNAVSACEHCSGLFASLLACDRMRHGRTGWNAGNARKSEHDWRPSCSVTSASIS